MKSTMKKKSSKVWKSLVFIASFEPKQQPFPLANGNERTNQFCIQYFPQSAKKQRECADVAERMYDCLEYITTDGDTQANQRFKNESSGGWRCSEFCQLWLFHGQDGRTDTNGNHDGKHGCEGRWLIMAAKTLTERNRCKVWTDWTNVQQGTDSCICPFCKTEGTWWMPFLMKIKVTTMKTVDNSSWKNTWKDRWNSMALGGGYIYPHRTKNSPGALYHTLSAASASAVIVW